MKKFLLCLSAAALGCLQVQAAVSVGATNGIQTFPAVPAVADWSTLLIGGTSADVTDAAGLDLAVQQLAASSIITPLGSSGTQPPSVNTLARFNTGGGFLQTRPTDAGTKMVVLMATLRNDSGVTMTTVRLGYDFNATNTPAGALPPGPGEEIPGHRVYYSITGGAGTWVQIPSLSTATPGHLSATLNVGSWAAGATMYLLWADDNGSGDAGVVGGTTGEGTYTIDNFSIGTGEPISVGPTGTGTLTFDTYPWESQWSTAPVPGGNTDFPDAASIDAAVQAYPASVVNYILGSSTTVTPAPSANLLARWNSVNKDLQTRTTGGRAVVLMATLRNDSGASISSLRVSYTLAEEVEAGTTIAEEVRAHRAFYNVTGATGDWHLIPEFSGGVIGALSATLNLGSWASGGLLYILWVDDNGSGGTTVTAPPLEGVYRIDNFEATTGTVGVSLTSPANGATYAQGVAIPISAAVVMAGNVTSVDFFENGNPLGTVTAPPYSFVYNGASLGAHSLTATGHDDQANSLSSTAVGITVVPNSPPTVTLTTSPAGPVLVGLNITNSAAVSDSDGSVTQVQFYVDAVLRFTDTTSPYTFEYCDPTAGTHIISAVAQDNGYNGGLRSTNSHTLVVTNPPSDVAILVANGATWKYLDDGTDQGTAWRQSTFVDTAWASGPAELGYGDMAGNNRPESTVVGFGPDTNAKYPTTYFRHQFMVANPADYTNLIVRLLRDDGGVVYINDVEVFRSYMTNGVFNYLSMAGVASTGPAAGDDGTIYQETSANPSVLSVGNNTLAVEIHQDALNSSDISFDLMLWGQKAGGPKLTIVNTGTQIQISWTDPANAYKLQRSDNIGNPANWGDVPGDPASPVVLTLPVSPNSRFFQLKVR